MGCCGGSSAQKVTLEELPKFQKTVAVYGDYFCCDLRTILVCMQYCGVRYQFNEVDTLVGEHLAEAYLEVNPTGQTPTVTDGTTTVVGGYSNQLAFLAGSNQTLKDKMYPSQLHSEIDAHMNWFSCILKPAVKKYTHLLIRNKAYGEQASTQDERDTVWTEIATLMLPTMESHLGEKQRNFFCTDDDLTIVDVQYYNAIQQLQQLDSSRKLTESRQFPLLNAWITKVM